MKKLSAILLLATLAAASPAADTVYVTVMTSNCVSTTTCGTGANQDVNPLGNLVYNEEGGWGAYTSAKAGNTDKVTVPGAFYHSVSFTNTSTPDFGIVLSPALAVTGGVYKVYHVFSSTANNVSTDVILGVTNVEGCTVSWTNTDKFQRKYGQPSPQSWQLLGYLTNNPDTSFPRIRFYWAGGTVDAGAQSRLITEQFKFVYDDPCTYVAGVTVSGPLSISSDQVLVRTVTNATKITVWQDSGTGMMQIGTKTTGIVDGDNFVTVSGLVKGAKVGATQTVGGVDGCKPQDGYGVLVGGGANPSLRLALSIKENPTATGPAGANGATGANSNIHFLPCSSILTGTCPGDDTMSITPGTGWQTVTVAAREGIGNSSNVVGTLADFIGVGYAANDSVAVQVYAMKNLALSGVTVFSATPAQSSAVTSNDVFTVNWTWDAVPGADGYRLLRNLNGAGYNEDVDVFGTTSLNDVGNLWIPDNTVTPKTGQIVPSYEWNGAAPGTLNSIAGTWGVLESIALISDDPGNTGPYNIYIDDLANGANGVFQDFEGFVAGTAAGAVFNQPGYSGTTSGNLLPTPDDATIVNEAAYSGTKSQRVEWQFTTGATNQWLRFNTYNTSVMPNPLVNLDQPISFRILVEPVGATPPTPPRPTLSVSLVNGQAVLTWTGAHNLQTSVNASGTYTNVPSVTVAPFVNNFPEPRRFFRLAN